MKNSKIKKYVISLFLIMGMLNSLCADTASDDRKYARFTTTNLNDLEYKLDHNRAVSSMKTKFDNATRYFNSISEAYKSEEDGVALVNRYSELRERYENLANAKESADAAEDAQRSLITEEAIRFNDTKEPYFTTYLTLACGRDGRISRLESHEIENFIQSFSEFKSYGAEFRKQFPTLTSSRTDMKINDYPPYPTIADLLDAFDHADEYYNKAMNDLCESSFNDRIEYLKEGLSDIESSGYITSSLYVDLFPNGLDGWAAYTETKALFEETGISIPRSSLREFNDLVDQITDLLIDISKNNKWDKSVYGYFSSNMETLFERKSDAELLKIGAVPEEDWTIIRNAFGTILRMEGNGTAVFRRPGVPFDIAVPVQFIRQYDGEKYLDVSEMNLDRRFYPYKRTFF